MNPSPFDINLRALTDSTRLLTGIDLDTVQRIAVEEERALLNEALWNKTILLEERVIESEAARQELKATQDQLVQSQKLDSIGKLAGGIAHEFNNLLGGILGYANLLKIELKDQPRIAEKLSIIEKSAERGAELTERILGFSRQGQYESTTFEVNDVICEAINLLERSIDKSITIHTNLSEQATTIKGDSTQILQILMNLGINARDAMENGGQLRIETSRLLVDAPFHKKNPTLNMDYYIKICVSDTGAGIPQGIQDKIFDPFFTTKEIGKGTGLGLSMIDGIVKNHQGAILLHTEENVGTRFEIYLPALIEKKAAETTNCDVSDTPPNDLLFEGETILIVDDEDIIRDLSSQIVSAHQAKYLLAKNGLEAVETYKEHHDKISLIMLDAMMPIMDGIQAFKEIRKINPEARILISSGYSDNPEIEKLQAHGPVGFIKKPFRSDELLQELTTLKAA